MKSILKMSFIAAVAVASGYIAYGQSQKAEALSDLALENVEALASGENGDPCGGPKVNGQCESRNTINCRDNYGCS